MATQRRKSSVQKRRSSMKRKYMKSRKFESGYWYFGKKAGDEDVAAEPQEEVKDEGVLKGVMDTN